MNDVFDELVRGCEGVIPEDDFKKKLSSNKPLRIKAGFDPTAPDIHLGHTVLLNKLRQFQDYGHNVLFLIGDFTARIGDPTGKNATRKPLSEDEIIANAETYTNQVYKILDEDKTKVVFNSSWLDELTPVEMIKLASTLTVARMLERDDFSKRFKSNQPISIHEFLYPLLQGYDSVVLKSDVELGGTDQRFNLLMGRELQQKFNQDPQIVMMMPLIEGLDGVKKMSKSLDNYIGITEAPQEMFGKIMSISDELMWRYLTLLSVRPLSEINSLKKSVEEGKNPRDIKIDFGKEIVTRFHSAEAAKVAEDAFIARFQKGAIPDEMPEVEIRLNDEMTFPQILKAAGLTGSTSEANRLIKQNAVKVDGERVENPGVELEPGQHVVQVGKRRFARLTLV